MGLAVSMMAEERWRDILMAEEATSFVRAVKCARADRCSTCVLSAGMRRARAVILLSWHRARQDISGSACTVFCLKQLPPCAFAIPLVWHCRLWETHRILKQARLPKPAKLMAVLENSPVLCAYGLQRSGSTTPAPAQVTSQLKAPLPKYSSCSQVCCRNKRSCILNADLS